VGRSSQENWDAEKDEPMRKRIANSVAAELPPQGHEAWLDLDRTAQVEVTSEDRDYPVDSVFNFGKGPGWRASEGGEQTLRVIFDRPQRLKRVWLHFVETERERTQEFTLRWSSETVPSLREIFRQQWNFSPNGSTSEIEDCKVDLSAVSVLELIIKPDLSRLQEVATLAEWRVA
jgi:hypothetical protein